MKKKEKKKKKKKRRREKKEKKTPMTNSRFGQEVCLSTCDVCTPTCPFLLTLMLGSSLKPPPSKKKVLARHNVPTAFMKGLANITLFTKCLHQKKLPR